jgi:RNA polymerase sigma-70 factor (ECF subfamily)
MPVAAGQARDAARPGASFETVWLEFRERMRAFVARRISNAADVDDIVQWVFLQMHRHLDGIRSGDRIHAWLFSTARRAVADYYRSRARRPEVASGDTLDLERLPSATAAAGGEEEDAHQEVAACLAPLVTTLAAADQHAITLTEIDGLRLGEAAARAGVSLSGMKSRVQRARARLKKAMLECCHIALDGRGVPVSCGTRQPARPCGCKGGARGRS